MVRRRAFLLITVLILSGILLVMGLAYLTGLIRRHQATSQMVLDSQAQALARAGLEEVRLKMNLDLHFPPQGSIGQESFNYSEPVIDSRGRIVGSYEVTLDSSYLSSGYEVCIITVTGNLLSSVDPNRVVARHTYRAYLDTYQPDGAPVNPTFWTLLRLDDLGVP